MTEQNADKEELIPSAEKATPCSVCKVDTKIHSCDECVVKSGNCKKSKCVVHKDKKDADAPCAFLCNECEKPTKNGRCLRAVVINMRVSMPTVHYDGMVKNALENIGKAEGNREIEALCNKIVLGHAQAASTFWSLIPAEHRKRDEPRLLNDAEWFLARAKKGEVDERYKPLATDLVAIAKSVNDDRNTIAHGRIHDTSSSIETLDFGEGNIRSEPNGAWYALHNDKNGHVVPLTVAGLQPIVDKIDKLIAIVGRIENMAQFAPCFDDIDGEVDGDLLPDA